MEKNLNKYVGRFMLCIAFVFLLLGFAYQIQGDEVGSIVGFLSFNIWDVGALIILYMEGKKDEKTKTKKVVKRRGQTTPETI